MIVESPSEELSVRGQTVAKTIIGVEEAKSKCQVPITERPPVTRPSQRGETLTAIPESRILSSEFQKLKTEN